MDDEEESLECPVCMEEYNESAHVPKMMPCLHTACATCLVDLSTPKGEGREGRSRVDGAGEPVIARGHVLICPMCRSEVHTDRIQTNRYILAHLRHLMKLEERMREEEGKKTETRTGGKEERHGEKEEERRQSEGRKEKIERRMIKRKLKQQIQEARRERCEIIRKERLERRVMRRAPPPPPPPSSSLPPPLLTAKAKRHYAPPPPLPPRQSSSSSIYPNIQDFDAIKSSSSPPPPPPLRPSPRSHRPPPPPPTPLPPPSPLPEPSAPPCEDEEDEEEEEEMWCRTCQETALHTCRATHHLIPLLKSGELEWIESQHQREQELKRRHLQAEQDRLLALKLAGVVVRVDSSTNETGENEREERGEGGRGREEDTNNWKKTQEENTNTPKNKPEQHKTANQEKANEEEEEEEEINKKEGKEEKKDVDPSFIDLSEWSYTQISDVINTSCDPDLLQACHREFDLRRKEYHRTIKRKKGWRRSPRKAPQPVTSP